MLLNTFETLGSGIVFYVDSKTRFQVIASGTEVELIIPYSLAYRRMSLYVGSSET